MVYINCIVTPVTQVCDIYIEMTVVLVIEYVY